MIVADYAWWRPDSIAELRDAGISGSLRYVDYPGAGGKGMSADEYRYYVDNNWPVAVILETVAQSASNGYNQGSREAHLAFAWADAVGWPADRPIYFCAEDPSPVAPSTWPTIVDYFRGVHDVDPAGRGRAGLVGAYGSGDLCQYLTESGLITRRWHVSTWPGGIDGATLVQEANGIPGYSDFGGNIDLDSVHAEDWGQVPAPSTPPDPDPLHLHGRLLVPVR